MRETGTTRVHGADLVWDRESEGDGPPIALLHAGISDRRLWDEVVDHLGRRPWVRYDLRGFGQSSLPDGPYDPYADLIGLLDSLGIERATVCGVSFGGSVAIDATLAAPDRVAALVVTGSTPFGTSHDPAIVERMEEAERVAEAGDLDGALEIETRVWVDGPERAPDQLDPALRARAVELNRSAWEGGMGGDGQPLEPHAAGRLGEIAVPTLVIVGALDQPSIRRTCEHVVEAVPGARLVVVDGVAHLVPLEQPQAFASALLDFLDAAEV